MDKIYVAKLGKTVGLKGQQKIFIDSDFPEQFKKNVKLYTDRDKELIIESYNSKNNTIKFAGIDNIEDAKRLTNKHLYISSEDTISNCKLEENQYFWFDIVNCEVFENDELLGKVSDIQRLPLGDYLYITTSKELVSQKKANNFLVPYLEEYIIKVDIDQKRIETKNTKDILDAS